MRRQIASDNESPDETAESGKKLSTKRDTSETESSSSEEMENQHSPMLNYNLEDYRNAQISDDPMDNQLPT